MTRVAAYCRVSTDKSDQVNSFESQKAFFKEYVGRMPDWTLVEIYADEGITGTTTKKRDGFLRMIEDAAKGLFEIIVTKEVSRFSRNILDAIAYTRLLREMGVSVIFLNDGISTADADAELRLGIMASVAQEESRKTSERVRWGQRRRMERGVVFGRSLLGYVVEGGKMRIEPRGAETVRAIYRMFLYGGMGARAIARALTEGGVPTFTGKGVWSGATVLKILKNEKYCGDLVQRKTVTADFLTHKKRRNTSEAELIRISNHHEPIIERDEWESAQRELERRRQLGGAQIAHGSRHALSGRVVCAGCSRAYLCRTRKGRRGCYRAWAKNERCNCAQPVSYIREELIAACARAIVASMGADALLDVLRQCLTKSLRPDTNSYPVGREKEEEVRAAVSTLVELLGSGEIDGEKFASERERLRVALESYRSREARQGANAERPDLEAVMCAARALAEGRDPDDGFYLRLVDRVEVLGHRLLRFRMKGSHSVWEVEFA